MSDRTAEAEAIVAATPPTEAIGTMQALVAARAVHALVMDSVGLLDHLRHIAPIEALSPDRDLKLENEVNDRDGSALLQGLLIEIRVVVDALIERSDELDLILDHEVMTPDETKAAIEDLREGPLGQAAARGHVGQKRTPAHGVTGVDGKSYPGSTARNEAQRARIVSLRRDHPDWSARRLAREVGCSHHTVVAVDETLARIAP